MTSETDENALEGFRRRLEGLCARIERIKVNLAPDLKQIRLEFETAQEEAGALGLAGSVEALRRLVLMTEVWECLALEGSDAPRAVADFCARALAALAAPENDGESPGKGGWILRESNERWSEYLQLLDPWSTGSASADDSVEEDAPPPPDEVPSLDPGELLRLLTGGPPASAGGSRSKSQKPAAQAARVPEPDVRPIANTSAVNRDEAISSAPGPVGPTGASELIIRTDGHRPPVVETDAQDLLVPSVADIDPEFRDAFLAEGTDLFERIEALVLNLGRVGDPAGTLHELGRCFHTLKGAAGSVGLVEFTARVHRLEDRLESCSGSAPPDLVDLLHRTLGDFERVLEAFRRRGAGRPAEHAPPSNTASAAATPASTSPPWPVRHEPANAAPARPRSEPRPDNAAAEASPAEGLLRIPAGRLDELMDLVSELIARRGVLTAQAETVKALAHTARACRNRLLASIDRLRDIGVSQTVDLPGLVRGLSEQAEDLGVLVQSAHASIVPLTDDGDAIARISLQIWDALQAIQIVPVRGLFQRLSRVARDAARVEGREVEVTMVGEETGLDRAVQDKAFEPLLHIVRNAVGHGIEPPEERSRAGKPAIGRVTLEARREGNRAVLVVRDDGKGLDYAAIEAKGRRLGLLGADETPGIDRLNALIFQSGFSTRQEANAISGRGVGMDVVAKEVGRLRGTIELTSQPGHGTSITIRLPTRLALERAMVVRVDGQAFAFPVEMIELAQTFEPKECEDWGTTTAIRIRDERVPLIDARRALGISGTSPEPCPKLLLVRADGEPLAVLVDSIDGVRELVVKPLGSLLAGHPVISGTSVSIAGEVVLSLNPADLARWYREGASQPSASSNTAPIVRSAPVLVVDDSISVRRVAARHLTALGFEVDEVSDGVEAIQKLRARNYRLVLTDLEMPRMDGFELLAQLDRMGNLAATPVVVTSTRSDPETRRRVLDLGAAAFVAKPIEPSELTAVVGRLGHREELIPA